MLTPVSKERIRAVTMELADRKDGPLVDLLVTAEDGSAIAIECRSDVILALQQHLLPTGRKDPEVAKAKKAADDDRVMDSGIRARSTAGVNGHSEASAGSDVTERIKAQRENVESRRIFEDLFANSDAAIIDHDFSILFRVVQELKQEGVRNLRSYIAESEERLDKLVDVVRINNANAAALRMLGVSSLQELGKQSINIVDIAEGMFQGETRIRRSEYLVAGGTPIPVVYSLRIPRTEEEAQRVPIVIMDLSDIKLAEAARQATVAKSQFLSTMSHEIRTPLNGVIGNLELLALTSLDNEQFELIDDADKAAKALLGLVGNILDFSKIEAGKLTAEMGDINPTALVEEAVDVLQSLGWQKKIFVSATFAPDVPSLVRGDAMRIRQILLNLIGNAVKFTDQGGVQVNLTVSAWDQEVCELRFEVHDSGRGFDQNLAARLFETFTQDRTAVDGAEGTGLGLSICKSLVEAFGGTIGCEGVAGEGATFWFTLPMAVVRRAPPVARPDLSGIRVMVIGSGNGATTSLADYFMARGAVVVANTYAAAHEALKNSIEGSNTVDVAMLVPDIDDDEKTLQMAKQLREQHVVPLLYGVGQLPRTWLRHGFAAMIRPDAGADHLDRNIRFLVGHAQVRDRLAAQQAAVVSAFGPALNGTHVLVLEDRLVNQTVIQKQLKKLGIDCTLAVNGIKGLEILDRRRFDLILCDCSMPEMNGYDFTRVLRRREASETGGRRVPVIALTANAFHEDADKCFEAGMDDFISKPVTMDRLAAMLVRWLSPLDKTVATIDLKQRDDAVLGQMIDIQALAEILGTDEPETLNQVLTEFLETAGSSLSGVEAAVLKGASDHIEAAAHSAKGEARCAAATGLAELYAELERLAKKGDQAGAQGLAVRAATELRHVEDYIRGRLGTQAA
ncbi:MAG: ATP-binding protein [Dongiaceae bacterium]